MMVMKRIILVSALAVAALFAVSCERERVPQPGNGGNDNGGGGGTLPSEVTYTYNNIPSADLTYVSTAYDDGNKPLYDVYDIVLASKGVTYDDNYEFSGVGAAVVIEVNTTQMRERFCVLTKANILSATITSLMRCARIREKRLPA